MLIVYLVLAYNLCHEVERYRLFDRMFSVQCSMLNMYCLVFNFLVNRSMDTWLFKYCVITPGHISACVACAQEAL